MLNQNPHRIGVPAKRDPNKFASTNITNEIVDALAGHHPVGQTSNAMGEIAGLPWAFIARISATGPDSETDFSDERYWGRVVIIAPAASDQPITLSNDNEATPSVIPIINLAEKLPADENGADAGASGNHGALAPGDWVYVYASYDAGGPDANLRYFTLAPLACKPCRVTHNGGSLGTTSSTCTATYDVFQLDATTQINVDIGPITPVGPPRIPNVIYTAATRGEYYREPGGSIILYLWNEAPDGVECIVPAP